MDAEITTESEPVQPEQKEVSKKPQFFVKFGTDFAGAGWMKDGKFGKFISIVVDRDLPKGSQLRISPRREFSQILN